MSRTVDERVVSMQFDNRQFENNVKTSMSTLERLKQSLNLTGAAKGLDQIGVSASKINLSGVGSAAETVRTKFSALQVMGVTALANITNTAINAGVKITKALTIDPIKMGFDEYETKINSIQTIMSNTASKGTTMEDVTRVIDELNTYADKTIYNFAEMTRNIGTFTAAGVGLEESASAIQGIANLAAASGSSSQQASTAMYQLSQALAAGTVKLMDWNSVVNAGMGGEKFQEALKATARDHGIAIDQMIKDNGSFRDSLQEGWISADILNETLNKFTVDGATKYAKSMMESGKWTQKQADALIKEAQSMEDAATKVKTFTQLWDTLKESAQSGWGKSWEIIIGDFEESKELFTEISDSLGGLISKSADARNKVLEGWKDLGGRTAIIDAFRNTFEGLGSIIKPISEAFREIFPPITAKQLYNFSVGLKNLTEKFKISDTAAKNLKSTFKGIFSVFSLVVDAVKAVVKGIGTLIGSFSGARSGALGVTGAIGEFLFKLRNSIKEADLFGKTINSVADFIANIIEKITDLGKAIVNAFKDSDGYKGIANVLTGIAEGFAEIDFSKGLSVLNEGIFAGILLAIRNFVKGISNPFEEAGDVLKNITGILDDVRGCFQAYQDQLKAGTLLKIASAIAILAGSIVVIASIDGDSLAKSLVVIGVLFGTLLGSLSAFAKITTHMVGVTKSCAVMISMSTAITILASALKKISSIDTKGIIKGLVGIGVLMAELSIFLNKAKFGGKVTGTAVGIVVLSSAMLILAKAVKNFGSMKWGEIGKGLLSIAALLTEITVFTKLTGNATSVIATATSMLIMGEAMKTFASVIKGFSGMKWSDIGKGLTAMAGALAEVAIAMRIMPKNMIATGTGLAVVAASMKILADALSDFGGMSWIAIGKGLTVMGGALAELAIALRLMNGTLAGSAALLIAAGALSAIAHVMTTLGDMSWGGIAKGLLTLAGAFTVIGVAGALLTPIIPSLLGLSAAFALLGVATVGIGAGLAAIATGFTALASAGAVGASAFVASLQVIILGVADLIPSLVEKLAEGVVAFVSAIAKSAGAIADGIGVLITEVLYALAEYAPKIVDAIMELLIGILESVADNLPRLITAAVKVIGAFFQGVVDALGGLDTEGLVKGIAGVGLLSGLMLALSAVASLIPGAMVGVLGMGVVIGELALVLAAIGAFAQIPGLNWLIEEGGNFLETLGTAIGKFIGGIAGGFMNGVSSSFPQIGSDLSQFMINLQPFITGAKSIDPSIAESMGALAKTILIITATDVLNGITSWLTGGNSMARFAEQLVAFGNGLKEYSKSVSGIDPNTITNSATAAKSLSELANNLPNSGGLVALFTGENDISDFGTKLVPFGEGLKEYSKSISGIDPNAITNSATAAKSLSELANNLPNTGGLASLFMGDKSLSNFGSKLVPFGKGLKDYSTAIDGINQNAITGSATAAKSLAELAKNLPNTGGLISLFTGDKNLATFGRQLVPFGKSMNEYAEAIGGIDTDAVTSSATAAKSLAELAKNLPNTGGLISLFTGDNDLASFASQLVPFGKGMKEYGESISGIDSDAVTASATAAKSLSELASNLPNSGGVFEFFTGSNDISDFGDQLKLFGKGMKDYSNAVKGIDSEAVTASATAAKALSELASNLPNSGGALEFFTGSNDISDFGSKLAPFGKGMKDYSNAVKGIDANAVTSSASAAQALSELAKNLPDTGGLVQWVTGESSISTFGAQLAPFGKSMKEYSNAVKGIDAEAVTSSTNAAKALGELANNLPPMDGVASWITGDNSLTTFGAQLAPFGKSMKDYSNAVKGIDAEAVSASTNAAKALAELSNNLPSVGGIAQWIAGENSLTTFGTQLAPFGRSMKQYADSVKGIDGESVTASANAAKSLGELAKNLPALGGISSWMNGENNLTTFGTQLAPFGRSMKQYADSVKGIDEESVMASTNAAKALGELANNLPDMGGISLWLSGESNLSTFGTQLAPFGRSMKQYADSVAGIDAESVTASTNAAKSLGELANNLPSTGSILGWLTGENNIADFASKLAPFGRGLKGYADSVAGIDAESVTASANAAKSLAELSNNLPSMSGLMGWINGDDNLTNFGSKLAPFGRSMKQYADSVAGIDEKSVTASTNAAKALGELANNLPSFGGISSWLTGDNSLSTFASKLVPLGKGLKDYATTVSGINVGAINSSVSAIKNLVSMLKSMDGINTKGANSFKNALNSLAQTNISGFVKAFSGQTSKLTSIGKNMTDAIIKGLKSKQSALTSTATTMINSMIKEINGKKSAFNNAGVNLINQLLSGLKKNVSKIKTTITSALKTAVSGIKGYYDSFYSAGSYLVTGFANGISANSFQAAAKARAMAKAALEAAEDELDENSPSKEFYSIGDYAGKGFVNALGDYVKKSYSAGANMASSARTGLSDAISRIADVVNSDIDTQPTIRPVLDLSDVSDGASAINGMLGMSPSISALSRARTISAMMNANQNGGNSDIISAIKDLKKTIGQASGSTNIINGITYDDGSTVSDAVKELIRAARIERRK